MSNAVPSYKKEFIRIHADQIFTGSMGLISLIIDEDITQDLVDAIAIQSLRFAKMYSNSVSSDGYKQEMDSIE